jgi:hypothetical protein
MIQKAMAFRENRAIKTEMDNAIALLKRFREKYPFVENPESIETLDPEDIFREQTSQVGDFFHWLEYYLYPIGHLTLYGSNVYRQIRSQFEEFKALLYVVVDKEKSIAEKVDAQWDEIKHLGGDKHIAKKIIFCFNFETEDILPIFKTSHLEHFLANIVEKPEYPTNYGSLTLGEKYELLNSEVLKVKMKYPETQSWEIPYFARFLYEAYPPPEMDSHEMSRLDAKAKIERQQQFADFVKLLTELQRKGKISGEEFRLNLKLWKDHPEGRKALVDRLTLLSR